MKLPHGLIWFVHVNGHPKERPELKPGRSALVSICFEMKRDASVALNNGTCRKSTVLGGEGKWEVVGHSTLCKSLTEISTAMADNCSQDAGISVAILAKHILLSTPGIELLTNALFLNI